MNICCTSRYYESGIGRFLEVDPDAGSLIHPKTFINQYTYVENDPINLIDPSGAFGFKGAFKAIGAAMVAAAFFGPSAAGLAALYIVNTDKDFSSKDRSTINTIAIIAAAIGTGGAAGAAAGGAFSGAIAGAAVGGTTGVGVNGATNLMQGKSFGTDAARAFGIGALAGGIAGGVAGANVSGVARIPAQEGVTNKLVANLRNAFLCYSVSGASISVGAAFAKWGTVPAVRLGGLALAVGGAMAISTCGGAIVVQ